MKKVKEGERKGMGKKRKEKERKEKDRKERQGKGSKRVGRG